jgi:hypothetical protein
MKGPYRFVAPSDVAVRCYSLLLHLYPPQFRKAYEREMTLLFRDCLRDARHEGEQGVLSLWLSTMFDVCVSAPRAHLEEWTAMQTSYTRSSQIGAICAFLAVLLWAVTFMGGDIFAAFGNTVAVLLMLLLVLTTFGAMAGLYFRVNVTERSPFTLIGGVCGIVGVVMALAALGGWLFDADNNWSWATLMSALGLLTLAFGLMGVSSSTQSTLGPLRFAPLLAFGFPIAAVMLLFFFSFFENESSGMIQVGLILSTLLGVLGTGALLWTKSK